MEFRFTPEQEALRREVRTFLQEELPPDHPEAHIGPEEGTEAEWEFGLDFSKKLAKRGWYTAGWPKEYGGMGFGPLESLILEEELGTHGVQPVNPIGMLVASLLMRYGSEELQQRHLLGIANCEVIWAEGYSEPNAGSDLASLQTVARREGDDYIVNGTKIWTGSAHRSQWMFIYARTDPSAPKHHGISYLLADMQTPGITVVPLENLAGVVTFNQEYFQDVRVPRANLLGEENEGWYMRRAGGAPRGASVGPDDPHRIRRHFEQLVAYCKEARDGSRPLIEKPTVRHKLAELAIEVQVARLRSYRGAALAARGEGTAAEAEGTGIFNRELHQRLARTGVEIMGLPGALLPEDARWAQLRGWFANAVMFTVASTIYGGTVEIHRMLLATVGLGLPRN